jgi:hypothetical protein
MVAAYPAEECVNVVEAGRSAAVIVETLHRFGARDWQFHALSLGSVGLCIGLWIRAKTVDQDERGNAERRALFVGLWAPTLWEIGDSLQREEDRPLLGGRRRLPWRCRIGSHGS